MASRLFPRKAGGFGSGGTCHLLFGFGVVDPCYLLGRRCGGCLVDTGPLGEFGVGMDEHFTVQ